MRPPSDDLRFVEPPLGVRVVTTTLVLSAGSVLAGSGIGFLVALGLWLTLEEGFPDVWSGLDLDPISRTGLAVTCLVAAIAAVVFALALSADRLFLGRTLRRSSVAAPLDVPPATVRRAVFGGDPFLPLLILSRVLIGVALVVGALNLLLWEEATDSLGGKVALGIAVFAAGGLFLLNGAMKAARDRWVDHRAGVLGVWSPEVVRQTVRAQKRRRPQLSGQPRVDGLQALLREVQRPLNVVGGVIVAAGVVFHFVGVFARQPGRNAERNSFAESGEAAIDLIAIIGASVVTIGLLVVIAGLASRTASQALARRAMGRADGWGDGRGPDRKAIEQELVAVAPARAVGTFLVALSTILAQPTIATLISASDTEHALHSALDGVLILLLVLLAVSVVGAVLIAVGEVRGRDFRQLLRDRWHPGDDPTPPAQSGRRSPRSARRRG